MALFILMWARFSNSKVEYYLDSAWTYAVTEG